MTESITLSIVVNGMTEFIFTSSCVKVGDLKEWLANMTGVKAEQQKMYWEYGVVWDDRFDQPQGKSTKLLDNDLKTLQDYGIKGKEATLIILRM